MQKYLIKIDRIAAWVLLAVVLAYIVSGFGMTKGIIDPVLARNLHLDWLGLVGLSAFVIHTFSAIRLALMRHRIWNVGTKYLLIAVYCLFAAGTIYVAVFYQPAAYQTPVVQEPISSSANAASPIASTAVVGNMKIFTLQELAKYNGQNGMPAYVAVSGKVYDLSSIFRNGYHQGHTAGADLTAAFNQQHYAALLDKFAIVGVLK